MKKLILSLVAAVTFATSFSLLQAREVLQTKEVLQAREDYSYIAVSGAYNWNAHVSVDNRQAGDRNLKFKDSPGIAIAFGKSFEQFRAELEFSYIRKELKGSGKNVIAAPGMVVGDNVKPYKQGPIIMVNLYYDVPVNEVLNWYIGGGAGVLFARTCTPYYLTADGKTETKNRTLFTWKGKTGLNYEINENVDIFGGYYMSGNAKPSGYNTKNFISHGAEAGIRFKF